MPKRSGHILALEVSEYHIAALRARAGSAGVDIVECINETGHWPAADGSLQRKLVELGEQHNFANDRVVYVFPRHLATVRMLELPSRDTTEIRSMVALSAEEWIPFNPNEVIIASAILHESTQDHSNVLAAVVPESTVGEHLQLLRGADIEPEHVFLSTGCLYAGLEYPSSHAENALYFHQSGNQMESFALHNGDISFTRSVDSESDSDEATVSAIHQSHALYQRTLSSVSPATSNHFSESAARSTTLAAQIDFDLQPAQHGLRSVRKGVEHLNTVPLPLLGAVLLAQGDATSALELLPETVTEQRKRDAYRKNVVSYASMAGLTVLLIFAVFGQTTYQRSAYLEELNARAERIRPDAGRILVKRSQLQRMESQVTREDTPLQNLTRVVLQAPDNGLNFTRFNYRHNEGITVQGRAKNPSDFSGMIDRLRAVGRSVYPQLATVQEVYRRQQQERQQVVWDFSISIDFPTEEEGAE